uniref:Uncharacterized protein n=1 Tax=Cyprinus carpio TaxID=7962 RepID=A0A8C2GZR5_CYPCA
ILEIWLRICPKKPPKHRLIESLTRAPSCQLRDLSKARVASPAQTVCWPDTEHPGITVVGTPDPIAWIRNKIILFLIELYFGLKFSVDHVRPTHLFYFFCFCLQAVDSVRKKCKTLSEAQKRHLAISLSDIIFLLPEDVSVFFDQSGRKFLYITMRLWYLSSADVPEDPESTRIFRMDLTEEDGPQKKIITAVYE